MKRAMSGRNLKKGEAAEAAIATVEAAYELRIEDDDWFPELLRANLPLLDHGLGAGGLIAVKAPVPGPPTIEAMHVVSGPDDLIARHGASMAALPTERTHEQTTTGVFVLSEKTAEHPEMRRIWKTFFDGAEDAIGLMTVDTDGRGIHILAPTPELVRLSPSERSLWEMMSAHVASGVRLRNALKRSTSKPASDAGLPFGAEAVINPTRFDVTDAVETVQDSEVLDMLRAAAVRIDRARVEGRNDGSTNDALAEWWALIRGRWSMVDWFDSDGRRYVLALPNPPSVGNPRGLNEREQQVVAFAALGDTHKLISYRLGISRSHVTRLLGSAMRKLGLKNQVQLVEWMRGLAVAEYQARLRDADGGPDDV